MRFIFKLLIISLIIMAFPMMCKASDRSKYDIENEDIPKDAKLLGETTPGVWFWRYSDGSWNLGDEAMLKHIDFMTILRDPKKLSKEMFKDDNMLNCYVDSGFQSELLVDALSNPDKELKLYLKVNNDHSFFNQFSSKAKVEEETLIPLENIMMLSDTNDSSINPRYSINDEGIVTIYFIPKYNYNEFDNFGDLGVNVIGLNYPKEGYGINAYSIYSHTGTHMGMAKGTHDILLNSRYYDNKRVPYDAIYTDGPNGMIDINEADSIDGETNPQLYTQLYEDDGYTYKSTHSEPVAADTIQIGDGTFVSGGSIGYQFVFPLAVYYKIIDNTGIPVEYITEEGDLIKQSSVDSENGVINYTFENEIATYDFKESYVVYEDDGKVNQSTESILSHTIINDNEVKKIVGVYTRQPVKYTTTGIIQADDRGLEQFDTTQAIPSSEDIYVNTFGDEYICEYQFIQRSGTKSYDITVKRTYDLSWSETRTRSVTDYHIKPCEDSDDDGVKDTCPGHKDTETYTVNLSDTQTVSKTYTVTRNYSYYEIDYLSLYGLLQSDVSNEVLPDGQITLLPENYQPPSVDTWHSNDINDHIIEPIVSELTLSRITYNGSSPPNENWSTKAEDYVGEIQVRNDRVIFNTDIIMDDNYYTVHGPSYQNIPKSPVTSDAVFYEKDLTINPLKKNGVYTSTASITYTKLHEENIAVPETRVLVIEDINDVTVHTPVVCHKEQVSLYNDQAFDQQINPVNERAAMILGRANSIKFIPQGNHLAIKGYGDRDYTKYTADKQVLFPFDIYIGFDRDGDFVPANTWYSLDMTKDEIPIYLPSWVDEGDYNVKFRTIAINAELEDYEKEEEYANLDRDHYVATRTVPVRVIGRLYGFKITDINDYPDWQLVFREDEDTVRHTGTYYYSGILDEDGRSKDRAEQYTIPLVKGSHPSYDTIGPMKTGYKFNFELETMGNYDGDYDGICIKPTFFFVDTQGNNKQKVDLWYSEKIGDEQVYFVQIGSERDEGVDNKIFISLGDPYRSVPDEELNHTSQLHGMEKEEFKNYQAYIGHYYEIILSKPVKTFVGNISGLPTDVDQDQVSRSVQKYYGQYGLPANLYISPEGTDVVEYSRTNNGLDGYESFWLKDGYLIIHFDINTFKDKAIEDILLDYGDQAERCNMWDIEGYIQVKTDSTGVNLHFELGDIMLYYGDESAIDDYKVGGTH
ncbi:DUF5704 domain-containing protein [Vallitalea okinawensis]|uniref:DUF5704 domain-containing protein n=1 Tax=Vallitalea okinawensis TaxID=2078660 RepID=UPI000CFD91AF|nr:DUF5704 domain-containing protein [Vallitalea okinawensis]